MKVVASKSLISCLEVCGKICQRSIGFLPRLLGARRGVAVCFSIPVEVFIFNYLYPQVSTVISVCVIHIDMKREKRVHCLLSCTLVLSTAYFETFREQHPSAVDI